MYWMGERKPPQDFKCLQCGHCCLNLAICTTGKATPEDIARWENEKRYDILRGVSIFHYGEEGNWGDLWINPDTGEDANRCPFLRKIRNQNKYKYLIQDTKPEVCRQYPCDKEFALKTGCQWAK
jgi:Fe-S-cluster containining protein